MINVIEPAFFDQLDFSIVRKMASCGHRSYMTFCLIFDLSFEYCNILSEPSKFTLFLPIFSKFIYSVKS